VVEDQRQSNENDWFHCVFLCDEQEALPRDPDQFLVNLSDQGVGSVPVKRLVSLCSPV
jgi:hypothetical protein